MPSFASAKELYTAQYEYNSCGWCNDRDEFTLESASTIEIELEIYAMFPVNTYFQLFIYFTDAEFENFYYIKDVDDSSIIVHQILGLKSETYSVDLEAGSYYSQVTLGGYPLGTVDITISTKESDDSFLGFSNFAILLGFLSISLIVKKRSRRTKLMEKTI